MTGTGGQLVRLDRRDVPGDYVVAVERYLAAAGISAGSARIYRISLSRTVVPCSAIHTPRVAAVNDSR